MENPLRAPLLALDVDEAEAAGDLSADKEIARQRLLLRLRLVPVDRLDRRSCAMQTEYFARQNFVLAEEYPARSWLEHTGYDLDPRPICQPRCHR